MILEIPAYVKEIKRLFVGHTLLIELAEKYKQSQFDKWTHVFKCFMCSEALQLNLS